MSLKRYPGKRKMKLLKRKIELSIGIQLKTLLCQLINKDQFQKAQTTGNKQGSAIVITVKEETKAKKLFTSGLHFGDLIKVVEKYKEVGLSLVCISCYGISHK